ncbi:MAG: cation:proton antiporter [Candidatus Hydrogenedentes bacterium]|nr:cation:proton antiporter [Candidatus Hydrogenedentota bacterium]
MDQGLQAAAFPVAGEMNPLLTLSVILLAGMAGGWAVKRIGLPGVTGYILAGVVIGPAALDFFQGRDITRALEPISTFAVALITMTVGSHLSYRRIHNALKRIAGIALVELAVTLLLVTLAMRAFGGLVPAYRIDWPSAFMLACIATPSPASAIAVIRETRAKGTFCKTMLTVIAIDNIICIMLFTLVRTYMFGYYEADGAPGIGEALLQVGYRFGGSILLGCALGFATERLVLRPHVHDISVVVIALLLAVGLAGYANVSPLLTSLFLGIYLGNASNVAARQVAALEPIEILLFVAFFTVAGVSLHLSTVWEVGTLCLVYAAVRAFAKVAGAALGGWISSTSSRIWTNMGPALIPQASVSIGLVVVLSGDTRIPVEVTELITTLTLAVVTINEIIGPPLTRFALARAGEVNMDRRRLIEFLQEEYILTDLVAADKWEAIQKLTDFFGRTHNVPQGERQVLHDSIAAREGEFSTAIGLGAAIPHGRFEDGEGISGVLAISREGIPWDAPDGQPVRLLMLVVTPHGQEREHLEVMASLASMISDEVIRTRLVAAIDANDAWEVIEGKETANYNYFLDQPEGNEA